MKITKEQKTKINKKRIEKQNKKAKIQKIIEGKLTKEELKYITFK